MYRVEKQAPNNKVIKEIRTKLNLSQAAMAEILDTEQSWLSKVERGLETPDWLIKFARLSHLLNQAGLSWEDVVISFPAPVDRVAEEPEKYKVD
jgi:transcriptional regulator with XRE-family HTH domain